MKRIVGYAMSAAVLSLIVAGLVMVGGPFQARAENRDSDRLSDLTAIQSVLFCETGGAPDAIPVEGSRHCDRIVTLDDARTDAVTGEPYRYEVVDDLTYRLCATFETDLSRASYRPQGFDPETGCLTATVRER